MEVPSLKTFSFGVYTATQPSFVKSGVPVNATSAQVNFSENEEKEKEVKPYYQKKKYKKKRVHSDPSQLIYTQDKKKQRKNVGSKKH